MDCWEQKIALIHRIVYFWISLCIGILFTSCSEPQERLPYFNSADFTPIFLTSNEEVEEQITHKLAPFHFLNQEGEVVSNEDIEGKIHVANFMFTSCGSICPKMTNHMKVVSDSYHLDEEVVLLSFSVMPWKDDVDVLHEYVSNKEITDKNWHFLTGDKSEIYEIARTSYFAEEDIGFTKDSADFLHTEHFILVDQNQRIRGIYNGTLKLDMRQLIDDIQLLKMEE